jgi:hypothetical protein
MKKYTEFIGENGTPLPPVIEKNSVVNEKQSVNENETEKKSWLDNFLAND